MTARESGLVWMLVTALLWSFLGLLSKVCLQAGLHPLECAFYRSTFGFLAFFAHVLWNKEGLPKGRDLIILTLFGVWGIGLYYSFAQYTILLAGAAMDIILQYTAPFWVALFARFLFGESLDKGKLLALSIAFIGTALVCFSGGSLPEKAPLLGIVTGLITGLCYASHFPFTRYWQKKYSSSTIFTWMLCGGSMVLAFLGAENGNLHFSHPPYIWLTLLTMGIGSTYFAFIAYGNALKRIGLVQAVITSELEPVLSMFWVWLFFGEAFSLLGWIGSILIIFAVCLLALWRERSSNKS